MNESNSRDYNDISVLLPEYNKAAKQLGLVWDVSFEVKKDERTCRIVSNSQEKKHEIWLTPDVLNQPELYKCDVMHELCHAKISESVDPCFSTIYFDKKYSVLTDEERADFNKKARMLYLAWCHVDIWINDLRHKHWPELTRKDILSFIDGFKNCYKSGAVEQLSTPETIAGCALNIAEIERNLGGKNKPKPSELLKFYDQQSTMLISSLANLYKKLPRLGNDKQENIKFLLDSVKQVSAILKMPINPDLVEEEGRGLVWRF